MTEVKAISEQEKKWRAESDARTLIEAEAIKADVARKKLAAEAASKMLEQKNIELEAIKKITSNNYYEKKKSSNK